VFSNPNITKTDSATRSIDYFILPSLLYLTEIGLHYAIYTIAIYGRLYTAEWRHRSTLLKCKWPPFFLSIQKFGRWITLFGCINVANNSGCVITFALFIKWKEQLEPSYQSVICFTRLLFHSIYIDKMKVALSWPDLYNKINTLSAVFFLPFRHLKTHKGNHTSAPCNARILVCLYCVHVYQ